LLPLAIEEPNWDFIWIESVKKKVNAINDMANKLELKNVKVIWTRAEDYKDKQFDILTARAVAYIDKLLKFTYHLVKKWWYFVLYKLDSAEEYDDIVKNCKKYNLELVWKYPYKLYKDNIQRVIYILKKK
jgi:16S rRNA (guanine527-N7)-methyltransferase